MLHLQRANDAKKRFLGNVKKLPVVKRLSAHLCDSLYPSWIRPTTYSYYQPLCPFGNGTVRD